MIKKIAISSIVFFSLATASVFAVNNTFKDLLFNVALSGVINPLIYILSALTVLVFIWGIIKFMRSDDSKEKEEGKKYMFWGIIAIFVMFSMWGLVALIQNSFDLNNNALIPVSINLNNISQ